VSTANPLTTLDGVEDGTDLAVVMEGRIEHWQFTDGAMVKDGHRLPPFFFSGLLSEQKIMPGDFTPPTQGDWFGLPSLWSSDGAYLVVREKGDRIFRCAYFRRDRFYEWRDVNQEELLSACTRAEGPDWGTQQFKQMTYQASEENEARVQMDRMLRATRDARSNIRYARDYLNQAITQMERETQ
jgi:hypothetical protein